MKNTFLGTLAALIVFSLLAGSLYFGLVWYPREKTAAEDLKIRSELFEAEQFLNLAAAANTKRLDPAEMQTTFQEHWQCRLEKLQLKPQLSAHERELLTKLERSKKLLTY